MQHKVEPLLFGQFVAGWQHAPHLVLTQPVYQSGLISSLRVVVSSDFDASKILTLTLNVPIRAGVHYYQRFRSVTLPRPKVTKIVDSDMRLQKYLVEFSELDIPVEAGFHLGVNGLGNVAVINETEKVNFVALGLFGHGYFEVSRAAAISFDIATSHDTYEKPLHPRWSDWLLCACDNNIKVRVKVGEAEIVPCECSGGQEPQEIGNVLGIPGNKANGDLVITDAVPRAGEIRELYLSGDARHIIAQLVVYKVTGQSYEVERQVATHASLVNKHELLLTTKLTPASQFNVNAGELIGLYVSGNVNFKYDVVRGAPTNVIQPHAITSIGTPAKFRPANRITWSSSVLGVSYVLA